MSPNSASLNPNIRISSRAVVLLSGGLDSATCAAIAKSRGFEVCRNSFRYDQRHAVELQAARWRDSDGLRAGATPRVFSLTLAWAERLDTGHIFIGVKALDYSGYPDCRAGYIEAFERMANLATKATVEKWRPVKIHAPLIPEPPVDAAMPACSACAGSPRMAWRTLRRIELADRVFSDAHSKPSYSPSNTTRLSYGLRGSPL